MNNKKLIFNYSDKELKELTLKELVGSILLQLNKFGLIKPEEKLVLKHREEPGK